MEYIRDRIVQVASDFYKILYKKDPNEALEVRTGQNDKDENNSPILKKEVLSIFKKLKTISLQGLTK